MRYRSTGNPRELHEWLDILLKWLYSVGILPSALLASVPSTAMISVFSYSAATSICWDHFLNLTEMIRRLSGRGNVNGITTHIARQSVEVVWKMFSGRLTKLCVDDQQWAARSPDLTPSDFFSWGFLSEIIKRLRCSNIISRLWKNCGPPYENKSSFQRVFGKPVTSFGWYNFTYWNVEVTGIMCLKFWKPPYPVSK